MLKSALRVTGVLCLLLPVFLFAQNTVVKIKVKDEDNLNLPGASVSLTPGNFQGITNQNGEVLLPRVPAGSYELSISYIGYATLQKKVQIGANGSDLVETMVSKAVMGTEVVVMGDRLKGQAKALTQQRNNFNITNIVSADQIGRFPDANIGDAMKRIPGITMQNDQGEARNIIIRGLAPELNSVTMNGDRIPSAEGDNRRVQMDLIPSDMIQTIEVNKTLLPDMDADAIGGSVNLVTRAAPNGLRLSATGSAIYNPIREKMGYNGAFIAGGRVANKKLGLLINGSINSNRYGSDDVEAVWAQDDFGNVFTEEMEIRKYFVDRTRRSLGATIDYSFNNRHSIVFKSQYNWRDDWENRLRYTATNIEPVYDGNDNIIGYEGEVRRETKGGIGSDRVKNRRLEDQRAQLYNLRGDHLLGKIKMDWTFGYSRASEERPNERYISFRRRNIPISLDIDDPRYPLATDNESAADYSLRELTEQYQDQYETETSARLNFKVPVLLGTAKLPGSIKFGGRLRAKKKVRENNFFEYSPIGANEDIFENMNTLPTVSHPSKGFNAGFKYTPGYFVSPGFLGSLDLTNTSLFESEDVPAEYLAANYRANETILAGYAMWQQQLSDRFSFIAGLRVENTESKYRGNIVEDEENFLGEREVKNSYINFLPHLSVRYDLTRNTVFRAAWSNALARPNYYDLVPYFDVRPGDEELLVGNPDLKAARANNFDLMAEQYFKSIGVLSAGVFYKTVDQFIYVYRDEQFNDSKFASAYPDIDPNPIPGGTDWTFFEPRNGDNVRVYGFEIGLQRQLDFLPGAWKGLGVLVNYTYTKSKAKGVYNADGELRENLPLPGTAPHMFNTSLSFENKRFLARVSVNFTAAYLDELGGESFEDRYYDRQFFLDANASYAITPKIRLFGEANNLTNQPLRYYQGIRSRTMQDEYYQARYNFGLMFDLSR
jgi:TonB-dependent receptor